MKKYFLFITLAFTSFCQTAYSQKGKNEIEPPLMPIDTITKQITYREVVQVEGTKDVLFDRAMEWIKKQYKNTRRKTGVFFLLFYASSNSIEFSARVVSLFTVSFF